MTVWLLEPDEYDSSVSHVFSSENAALAHLKSQHGSTIRWVRREGWADNVTKFIGYVGDTNAFFSYILISHEVLDGDHQAR